MNNIQGIAQEILSSGNQNEIEYFNFHKRRYERFESFLNIHFSQKSNNPKLKVLDIGSHYLHSSMILANLDFNVDGMDVSEFWKMEFVKSRGERYGIHPVVEDDLSGMSAFEHVTDKYDLVVFTEIMEHITFNPIMFWKRIYQILKPGGKIYLSTPNAFALPNYVRNLKNLLFMKSIGITVEDILSKVTYGHHWKEYSAQEIKIYFQKLSPDFEVMIHPYYYSNYELKPPHFLFKLLSRIGNKTQRFAGDLEVIVTLRQKSRWTIREPEY